MPQNSGTTERLERLLQLVVLLQSGRRRSVSDLSIDLKVSRRTIFRDIALLRDVGLPIVHQADNGGVWLMKSRFQLPRINPEKVSLLLMAVLSSSLRSLPEVERLTDAFAAEVLDGLSADQRVLVQRVLRATQVEPPQPVEASTQQCVVALVKSIETQKKARLWVVSPPDEEAWSTLSSPLWLQLRDKQWKVFAHSSLHQQVCGFHIRNLERVQVLDDDFDPQTIRRPRDFETVPTY